MSLLLLFTPSYFEGLHDSGPKITDRYKRKFRREVEPAPEIPIVPEEEKEEARPETISPPDDSKERRQYLGFLRSEISNLTKRMEIVSGLKEVLEKQKQASKLKQLESFRQALDREYIQVLQAEREDEFLMLAFLHLLAQDPF